MRGGKQYFQSLPQVICKQCNHCRDLDLCKDPHVLTSGDPDGPAWVCSSPGCRTPYSNEEIEAQLVDALQRKTMGYTLQVNTTYIQWKRNRTNPLT